MNKTNNCQQNSKNKNFHLAIEHLTNAQELLKLSNASYYLTKHLEDFISIAKAELNLIDKY